LQLCYDQADNYCSYEHISNLIFLQAKSSQNSRKEESGLIFRHGANRLTVIHVLPTDTLNHENNVFVAEFAEGRRGKTREASFWVLRLSSLFSAILSALSD
jgi:hypothetical protein